MFTGSVPTGKGWVKMLGGAAGLGGAVFLSFIMFTLYAMRKYHQNLSPEERKAEKTKTIHTFNAIVNVARHFCRKSIDRSNETIGNESKKKNTGKTTNRSCTFQNSNMFENLVDCVYISFNYCLLFIVWFCTSYF